MKPEDFLSPVVREQIEFLSRVSNYKLLNIVRPHTTLMGSSLYRSMNEAAKVEIKIKKMISNVDFSHLQKSYDTFRETFDSIEEDVVKFNKIVIELGYPPHGDIPFHLMLGVVGNYETEGIEEIKEYIDDMYFEIYDDKKIDSILVGWEKLKLLNNRMPILRQAIKCHNQQMFFASIPALLPQFEGILAEAYSHMGKLNGYQLGEYIEKTFEGERESDYSIEDALCDFYLNHILVYFEHGEELKSDLSRHAILHGADYKYGTKQNSLKLILMFDFLSNLLENAEEKLPLEEINL